MIFLSCSDTNKILLFWRKIYNHPKSRSRVYYSIFPNRQRYFFNVSDDRISEIGAGENEDVLLELVPV